MPDTAVEILALLVHRSHRQAAGERSAAAVIGCA
jgi:hypothetical protein